MNIYYVYRHYKLNTNEVFYIGMGKELNFRRSNSKRYRNNHWHNIVNKYGYSVEIVAKDLSEQDAIELEVFLISHYGRQDLKTGCLVNMTDGGEGVFNPSEASLYNRSGARSSKSKRVKNMDTGEIFNSLVECCDSQGLVYMTMKNRLRGAQKNKTPYTYINELNEPISKYNEDLSQPKCACKGGRNKECINTITKQTYRCIREASESIGIKKATLKSDILRKRYNYNIMYLEDYAQL